jgi:hypothetical protein
MGIRTSEQSVPYFALTCTDRTAPIRFLGYDLLAHLTVRFHSVGPLLLGVIDHSFGMFEVIAEHDLRKKAPKLKQSVRRNVMLIVKLP